MARGAWERSIARALWASIVASIEGVQDVYERMNKIMSLGLEARLRSEALERLASNRVGGVVVDVGAGPGTSTHQLYEALEPSYIVALDPSPRLLTTACSSISHACERVVGVAEKLPLRKVSTATAFFSARDFMSLESGVEELARVAERILVVDVFLPEKRFERLLLLAWVCAIIPFIAVLAAKGRWREYRVFCRTLQGWLTVAQLAEILAERGFRVEKYSLYGGALGFVFGERP